MTRAIGPSPARAEPHDASAWLPLPDDVHALPPIAELLDQTVEVRVEVEVIVDGKVVLDLVALESIVSPSPARAEPHDASAWLPLPEDVHDLPALRDLLDPHPEVQAAVVAEAEAVVQSALAAAVAVVAPSPARAEPHDAGAWFPLPSVDDLPQLPELAATQAEGGPGAPARPKRRHRVGALLPSIRVLFVAVLVTATVLSGAWIGSRLLAPAGSEVSLYFDGGRHELRTEAATVGALLALRHVHLATGDTVTPSPTASLHDGLHVDVLRSFPVTVDVDGTTRTVRTTQSSADALAKQMHLGKLVAVRDEPGRLHSGSSVVFRTRKGGSLALDGQTVTFDSPSRTIGELLDAYHVNLVGDDYVTPSKDSILTDGATVAVVRVGAQTVQGSEPIPFDEARQPDPNLPIGQTREVQVGKDGVYTVTSRERMENGAAAGSTVLSKVPTVAPKPHIVAYGTEADWHWDKLAECESGGRWDTVDASPDGYDGGLGIFRGTWRAFGGLEFAPNAGLTSRENQIIVGQRIYDKYGWDPWGCANNVLHW